VIAATELAALARLAATGGALGVTWKTLKTFPADWEAAIDNDKETPCPAGWIVCTGWNDADQVSDGQLHVTLTFGLVVGYENLRPDEQVQRHGGVDQAQEPGSYKLLLAATTALAGQTLGLDMVEPIKVGAMRPVAPTIASHKRRMSRYAIELSCRVPLALVGDGETDPAELQLLHANWDIPAFDDPIPIDADPAAGRQLPDDRNADATDTVTLETE
jgi:phage gp37-like protein